ncbi:MAG: HD domain-containing protein [Armatimonadetes bacterium]|nr:HD domain-containing protein [Armatimonadota bacterium]
MAVSQCPGQDRRFWKPTDIFELPCSYCGEPLEFWKDDLRRRCHSCGRIVPNPRFDLGCAQWCQFSAKCLGQPAGDAGEALVDALIREMRAVFGDDQGRIRHALAVLDYAEQILVGEGGDPLVVRAAAVLHDIGIEGPPIARPILERLGVDTERAGQVLRIIGSNHSARDVDTPEFRILWDADRLASIPDECGGKTPEEARILVERFYRTATGCAIGQEAVERFLGTPPPLV